MNRLSSIGSRSVPVRPKVLLVSRDPGLAEELEVPLETNGYDLLLTCSEAGARSRVRVDRPDLVLLDLGSFHDETVLLRDLQVPRGALRVPVIVLARNIDAGRISRCFDQGAAGCVTGRLDPLQVVRKIKRCLRLAELSSHTAHQAVA